MNISGKRLFALVALFCTLTVLIAGPIIYSYAAGTISNANFEAGTQVETASMVIWKEGSTYYAKNGSSGVLDVSTSNFSYVFQYAINHATNDTGVGTYGATIGLRKGVYPLTQMDSFRVPNGKRVVVRGEGQQVTWLRAGSDFPSGKAVFNLTNQYDATAAGLTLIDVSLQNFQAGVGALRSATGICIWQSPKFTDLIRVYIESFDVGINITRSYNHKIDDCFITSCNYGIILDATAGQVTQVIDVVSTKIVASQIGAVTLGYTNIITFRQCEIENFKDYGIKVCSDLQGYLVNGSKMEFDACYIESLTLSATDYVVNVTSSVFTQSDIKFSHCNIDAGNIANLFYLNNVSFITLEDSLLLNVPAGKHVWTCAGTYGVYTERLGVYNIVGSGQYYNPNSGVISSPANGSYVEHELPNVPSYVQLTCNGTKSYAWVTETNSTHFRYYFAPSTPTEIFWNAEVEYQYGHS